MAEKGASSETWPLAYKMNKKKRGLALIFNQETFNVPGENLKQRCGTAVDKQQLTERFKDLGFDVKHYDNMTKTEMLVQLSETAGMNHSDSDCFVCIILSHGEEDHIYAADDKVKIQTVTDQFRGNSCKSLIGKPKIFIIQACAGKKLDDSVTVMAGGRFRSEEDREEEEEDMILRYTLPASADFLMCSSVVTGFASFRDTARGTFYIQDLCETLKEHGSTMEFTELLTLVSWKVSRRTKQLKQMPCFTSMLTKKLYFIPKN